MVPETGEPSLTIYASFYPIYALALNVIGDVPGVTLKCLTQPQDGCLRNYALSEWDAAVLSTADAVLMGGRGLESFESTLASGTLPMVTLMDGARLLGQDETVADEEEAGHFVGANPWLWLSPEGAREMAQGIASAMAQLDPQYEALYNQNLTAFERKIDKLMDGAHATGRVALMHEGLIYFAQAMGLTAVTTVQREPGTDFEVSELETALAQLSGAEVDVILIETQAPTRLVRELSQAGYTVVKIDTLTAQDQADPDAYLSTMADNFSRVKAALAQ